MSESKRPELVRTIVDAVLAKKAENVVVMDLRGLLDVTDWFVIASGLSEIQMQAMSDAVVEATEALGEGPTHVEGRELGRWILLDFVDVVVHLMLPTERDRYRLERLWGEASLVEYDERGEPRRVREATPATEREGGR